MNDAQWRAFNDFKTDFKAGITEWRNRIEKAGLYEELQNLQRQAAENDGVPPYSLDTPLVYNASLDTVDRSDDIRIILIGDNPGKDEQLERNRRYLVGQSGKIADGFFRKNPELNTDFRKNVLILNKTPLHTAKTKELAFLIKEGNPLFAQVIRESQIWFAQATVRLHRALCDNGKVDEPCMLWLVGYAELRARGLFADYKDTMSAAYGVCAGKSDFSQNLSVCASQVFVYQHFSMNRFLIDLKERYDSTLSLAENLKRVGRIHREEIFGW